MPAFRFLPLEFCRLRKYKLLIIPPSSFRPACFVAHRHIAHLPIMINCSFGRLAGPHTETTGWPAHQHIDLLDESPVDEVYRLES